MPNKTLESRSIKKSLEKSETTLRDEQKPESIPKHEPVVRIRSKEDRDRDRDTEKKKAIVKDQRKPVKHAAKTMARTCCEADETGPSHQNGFTEK